MKAHDLANRNTDKRLKRWAQSAGNLSSARRATPIFFSLIGRKNVEFFCGPSQSAMLATIVLFLPLLKSFLYISPSSENLDSLNCLISQFLCLQELDFESVPSYKFKVKVSDGGDPSLSSFTDVEISVEDVNDLPPKFVSSTFSAAVYLPTPSGSEVLQVSASDGDTMPLANLSFSIITPPYVELFDISQTSGVVTVKNASLLEETVYQVRVIVADGNFTDKAVLVISCKALSPGDLKFTREMYNTSVLEGISLANDIAEVRAVGYSVGEIVSYSIVSPSDLFVISESTGVVSTAPGKEFDREAVDRYQIVVQVRDYQEPWPRVAQSVLSVTVGDVNDNKPRFTEESYFFVVQKSVNLGFLVGSVVAVDEDAGSNGEVRYAIICHQLKQR